MNLITLASFTGANGQYPNGDLIEDSNGNLFGTTNSGGAYNDGSVFEITAGAHALITLFSFNGGDGAFPEAGLLMDANGNLFGTTEQGGQSGNGTVFEIAAGSHNLTTISFIYTGSYPECNLVEDSAGNLYGTTSDGGGNEGTVFEVAAGTHAFTTLVTFTGTANGGYPLGGLVMDNSGNFYGTTSSGGANNDGTVSRLPREPTPLPHW